MNDLRPYEPSPRTPWDAAAAAHLLRRAGFAPSMRELRATVSAGPHQTITRLIDGVAETPRYAELTPLGPRLARRDDLSALRSWWLLRMAATANPLRARLAVFWHNHFATSNAKVRSTALMAAQLETVERFALGRFGDLLAAIARDPAMIIWLDGDQNAKGRPNENFAREMFELFTLGVSHYREQDIREAARAFSGWHQRGGRFHFARGEHDQGEKCIFGVRGRLGGDDVMRITLSQPACAAFLAAKLLREFVCPQPPPALIDALAARLRETDYDIAATLRALFSSAAFFDPRWRRSRIKSPVEYAIGIVRSLELRAPGPALASAVSEMGQRLFEPPSVKGWDGHRTWINDATMLVRLNAAARATRGAGEFGLQPAALRDAYDLRGRDALLEFCAALTLDGAVPPGLQDELFALHADDDALMRQALRLLLSSPQYQMA